MKNRATVEIRNATQKKGAAALRLLWKLCLSKDEKVADAALARWLAYAFGRPVDRQELTGADGAPLHGMATEETGRRVAYILAKAEKEAAPSNPTPAVDQALRHAFEEAQRARFTDVPAPPEPEPAPEPERYREAAAPPLPVIHTPLLLRSAND